MPPRKGSGGGKKSGNSGKKSGGGKKETTQRVSTIASKGLRTRGKLTRKETMTVSASALGQDETKGRRKKK